jgi:glycosyltransferase involved in cell wall biosynthesis
MHVLRHIDRQRFQMDFLVSTSEPQDFDEEIRALNSRVIPCPRLRHPLRFACRFRRRMREYSPYYDVVHSHLNYYNGFVLRLAAKAGVGFRIAHSHADMRVAEATGSLLRRSYPILLRRAYPILMKRWIDRYATARLACSYEAGIALFGERGGGRPSWQVLHCGLDFEPFRQRVERTSVRTELGIPEEARVIGHVGRFIEQKNHRFLIEIMAEVARRDPKVYLLLVGDGLLRAEVERDVARRSLQERVVFTGVRADVPRLMLGAMDVFVFPSLYEGNPLVGVEAQAAGLQCLFADTFTSEADLVPGLVRRLPLGDPSVWGGAIRQAINKPRAVDGSEALAIVERSPHDIRKAVEALERVYEGAHATCVQGAQKR